MSIVEISCIGKDYNDCVECGRYFSGHSLYYCQINKIKVSEITCSIGGNRTFNESGDWINKGK